MTPKPMRIAPMVVVLAAGVAVVLLALLVELGVPSTSHAVRLARESAGSPARGAEQISAYGCGSCHTIPGIRSASGVVGPNLAHVATTRYIAGRLPMTTQNLEAWIEHPQQYDPGVLMPEMHVTPQDARDIAAYLLAH
jgi:cytochrome c